MTRWCVGLEAALYTCLAPLQPYFARRFHFGPATTGLLVASASLGGLLGIAFLAVAGQRLSVRRRVVAGLLLVAASCMAFAVVPDTAALVSARTVQGFGGTLAWEGVLELAMATPAAIGESLGVTFAAATYGTLIGPVLGTAAVVVSPAPIFVAAGVTALFLAYWISGLGEMPAERPRATPRLPTAAALLDIGGGSFMYPLCWAMIGFATTLIPLDLHARGASVAAIGAIFATIAGLNALSSPRFGRLCDRVGPRPPLRIAPLLSAAALAALASTGNLVATAALAVLVLGVFRNGWLVPAAVLIGGRDADAGSRAGSLRLLLWTIVGEGAGAVLAGTLSEAAGQPFAFASLATVTALGTLLAGHQMRTADGRQLKARGALPGAGVSSADAGGQSHR